MAKNFETIGKYVITYYATQHGLDYVTISCDDLCLGSEPLIRKDIDRYSETLYNEIVRKDTKQKLIEEMNQLSEALNL